MVLKVKTKHLWFMIQENMQIVRLTCEDTINSVQVWGKIQKPTSQNVYAMKFHSL